MKLIEVTDSACIVPDAVGAVEYMCERLKGSSTMIFETVVRSSTGQSLFFRKDSVKLDDGHVCEQTRLQLSLPLGDGCDVLP